MKTTNIENLRAFYSVVNRKHLNREVYNYLLKRWDLDKVDLDLENEKIKNRLSTLSRSRREAVPEFLIIRSILNEMEKAKNDKKIEEEISFN